jgi:hypothetical protein
VRCETLAEFLIAGRGLYTHSCSSSSHGKLLTFALRKFARHAVFYCSAAKPRSFQRLEQVSRLCERTLLSICQQTSSQFRVFLLCRDLPEMNFAHPNLRIIQEDFPIPEAKKVPQLLDKTRKLRRALIAVREEGADM